MADYGYAGKMLKIDLIGLRREVHRRPGVRHQALLGYGSGERQSPQPGECDDLCHRAVFRVRRSHRREQVAGMRQIPAVHPGGLYLL
jgi:hypothetical protein